MASVNKVIVLGRLGKDPEMRKTNSGKSIASFSIATSERYKDAQGQQQESTEWHNITLWNKQAELACQYLKKGSMVYIEGKLKTDSWDNNGTKHYKTVVEGNVMQFLDSKPQGNSQQQHSQQNGFGEPQQYQQQQQQQQQQQHHQPQIPPQGIPPQEDDLPF